MKTVQNEGGRTVVREQEFYNLDVIIAVEYRVNSVMATQFRIWATQILKTYLLKGYATVLFDAAGNVVDRRPGCPSS